MCPLSVGIILFMYSNIKLTLGASVVLRCTGKRQNDGQFLFVILYDIKEYFSDCEKQWLVNVSILCLKSSAVKRLIVINRI